MPFGWSFCWRQQFARVTQKPQVDVSKSHASCKNKLQSNKASRMDTPAYWNPARVYVDSRSCEKKCEILYPATLNRTSWKLAQVPGKNIFDCPIKEWIL